MKLASENTLPELSHAEILRYGRHLILPDVGIAGQRKLKAARVLIVGAGGLGSPLGLYLAAAGVGNLGLVDFDVVDVSNLQRQVLHGTKDVGRSKLASARDRLHDVNPHVQVTTYQTALDATNALEIIGNYDLVVDGTDNFTTRYLVNDACVLAGKPNVYGSIFRFEGQCSIFATGDGPCYRCLYREPPPPGLVPNCAEGGVLGVLPGLVGLVQATEAIKWILGIGDLLVGRLLLIDALGMRFRPVKLRRDPQCPACGTREIKNLTDVAFACAATPAAALASEAAPELSPRELAAKIAAGDDFDLIDVREPHEWQIARIDGAKLVPLATVDQAATAFDPRRPVVVYCKAGVRGQKAAKALRRAGFTQVWNLAGGISRWSDEVDAGVPKY